jgi:NAD(P)-dependent dehydrogenase (short-subunit alcohol dehydrogenase family)
MSSGKVFITGNSSGLGLGFTQAYLQSGWEVYGLSRRGCPLSHDRLHDIRCDAGRLDRIADALQQLLGDVETLDLVILNAGILGEIKEMTATSLQELNTIMDINVWSNKVMLDWLIARGILCRQVLLISSGAAVNGSKGWGGYSLSKATLNMLAKLYAPEMPASHLTALAPGLVDTAMQDYLCDPERVDVERFPTLQKLRNARGSDAMPTPDQAAASIIAIVDRLRAHPSGSFLDIRTLDG